MRISMNNKQFCLLHQFLNKAVSLLIVLIIVITLSGCSLPWNQKQISETTISATEDNADFTDYVNNLFADLLSADMVSLHAYVEHPRDFGINDYEITLGRYDLDNPDDTSDYTDIISTLKSFDRSTLTAGWTDVVPASTKRSLSTATTSRSSPSCRDAYIPTCAASRPNTSPQRMPTVTPSADWPWVSLPRRCTR